jgi:hypothetical protein
VLRNDLDGRNLGLVNQPAFCASQCPVLESGSSRDSPQPFHADLAYRTARLHHLARWQLTSELGVRHMQSSLFARREH